MTSQTYILNADKCNYSTSWPLCVLEILAGSCRWVFPASGVMSAVTFFCSLGITAIQKDIFSRRKL